MKYLRWPVGQPVQLAEIRGSRAARRRHGPGNRRCRPERTRSPGTMAPSSAVGNSRAKPAWRMPMPPRAAPRTGSPERSRRRDRPPAGRPAGDHTQPTKIGRSHEGSIEGHQLRRHGLDIRGAGLGGELDRRRAGYHGDHSAGDLRLDDAVQPAAALQDRQSIDPHHLPAGPGRGHDLGGSAVGSVAELGHATTAPLAT